MADQIVITEKTSQAKDVRTAVGSRYGNILPAEGHLIDLQEPEEADPAWKRWTPILLRPEGLYGTRPAVGGNKAAKLAAIREALRTAKRVWLDHRLRPRRPADRSGNSRTLQLPRSGDAGAVHRAGFPDHPRRIWQRQAQLRIFPPVCRRGRTPAG